MSLMPVLIVVVPSHLRGTIVSFPMEKWHSSTLLTQLNSSAKQLDADFILCFAISGGHQIQACCTLMIWHVNDLPEIELERIYMLQD